MDRITVKHLQAIVDRINRLMGTPAEPWTKGEDGKIHANIGNYHLSGAYGGYSLHQMMSDGGGVYDTLGCGHIAKRELADRMHAFIRGIESKAA